MPSKPPSHLALLGMAANPPAIVVLLLIVALTLPNCGSGGRPSASNGLRVAPVHVAPFRVREIYLVPHSHNDIGYTSLQTEAEHKQWQNIDEAVELALQTASYPRGTQYKWNTEVLWAVESYLVQASEEKRKRFIEAVKSGRIGLQSLYANELTGLCSPEELFRLTGFAERLSKKYGFTIHAAMISDVPAYSWGIVPVLSHSGIKYFFAAPNSDEGSRIGYGLETFGDKPFYWYSASGQERVLTWVAGKGYGAFFRIGPIRDSGAQFLADYVAKLDEEDYPYDMVLLPYGIGGDNGPSDPDLPDFVREWNETHVSPKLVISTVNEFFPKFERRYGKTLPRFRGDFTPYWEDGAASSAHELALNRNAADRLAQAEALFSMVMPESYPAEEFYSAWRNVLLFDEHTWGANNSVAEPDDPLAVAEWQVKQRFALEADRQSRELLAKALGQSGASTTDNTLVEIYNTNSWRRTDVVFIPAELSTAGDLVYDEAGAGVPSQRLSTGELTVLVRDIPPFGSKRLRIAAGAAQSEGRTHAEGTVVANSLISVKVSESTGAIGSLVWKENNTELVDSREGLGLNEYLYVAGIDAAMAQRVAAVTVSVKENGPLVASLLITSDAPGARKLTREVRLLEGIGRVDILDMIDKESVRDKEGVHIAFPFNVPEAELHLDVAYAAVRPEKDQLPGSNKNWFPVQRGVDVSNQDYGVTWVTVDAPLVEWGAITAEVPWKRHTDSSPLLFSYVMNNYWFTNYKADQEGEAMFRYSIRPHGPYDAAAAKRFGLERSQPLIIARASAKAHNPPLLWVEPSRVLASLRPSDDGEGWMVTLFNASESYVRAQLRWRESDPRTSFPRSSFEDSRGISSTKKLWLPPSGVVILSCRITPEIQCGEVIQ